MNCDIVLFVNQEYIIHVGALVQGHDLYNTGYPISPLILYSSKYYNGHAPARAAVTL